MTRVLEGQVTTTPTVRRFFARARFWIILSVLVIIAAIVSQLINSPSIDTSELSPTGTGTRGAKAVLEVLRGQGVTVTPTSSLVDTRKAITNASDTTLLVYDDGDYLNNAQYRELAPLARHLILVTPNFSELRQLAPAVRAAGKATGTLRADCDVPAVRRAGTVAVGDAKIYRLLGQAGTTARCLARGNGAYALIRLPRGTGDVSVFGAIDVLTNQHIIEKGNAALALGLLGQTHHLVWYLPSFDDEPVTGNNVPTLAEASPGWVIPTMLLVFLTVIAAGIWRGRRFGPLVVERLPVIVPASETMEGRARLYQKSSARLHALDALRMGTIDRVAVLLGLPRRATTDEVVLATVSVTERALGEVRHLLLHAYPRTDAALVTLSDQLLILERDVQAAVLGGASPTSPTATTATTEEKRH